MNVPARLWAWWCGMSWRMACALAVGWTVAWSLAFSIFVFDRTPHIPDGATYLFQAKIFASGRLMAPVPPLPEFFEGGEMVLTDGGWFGKYPPGQSLILLPGVLLGIPWLIPALCAGAVTWGSGTLARRWAAEPVARLTLLFAAGSPFLLTHGGMYLAHVSGAAVIVWWMVMMDELFARGRGAVWALGCGLLVGFAFWIRPYTAVALAAPAAVFCLRRLVRPQPGERTRIVAMLAGGGIMVIGLLLYNNATTGDPFLFGYRVGEFAQTSRIGFHPYPRHAGYIMYTPMLALRKTLVDLWWLNTATLGAPFPALLLLLLAVLKSPDRRIRHLAWLPVSLIAFQFFYYYSDNNHGPRMYLEALPFICILAAAGARVVAAHTPLRSGTCLLGLLLVWGVATPMKMHLYGGNYAGLPNLARPYTEGLDNALVFLDTNHTLAQQNHILMLNNPTLDGDVVFARDLGKANGRLTRYYADRAYYRLRYWVVGSMLNAQVVGPTFTPYVPENRASPTPAD